MSDNKMLGGTFGAGAKDAVCIHTRKVYDACRSKDCIEDVRVYLTTESQSIVDRAINIKPKCAIILWTYLDVEPVPFNDGFYTVDVKHFYRITADAFCGIGRPTEIEGLATFDKRAVLYGGEGKARVFSSQMMPGCAEDQQLRPHTNLPVAVVEVVDPIVLSVKAVEPCDNFSGSDQCGCACGCGCHEVPEQICGCFRGALSPGENCRRLYATLGQFSIIRLERDTQVLVPFCDYCIPEKECPSEDKDPCDLFGQFRFPISEFFPPDEKKSGDGRCR